MINDFVVYECLNESRLFITGELWEGKAQKTFRCLEWLGRSVGYQYGLVELMSSEFNVSFFEVGIQLAIKVPDLSLFIVLQALGAFKFGLRVTRAVLSLDEKVT